MRTRSVGCSLLLLLAGCGGASTSDRSGGPPADTPGGAAPSPSPGGGDAGGDASPSFGAHDAGAVEPADAGPAHPPNEATDVTIAAPFHGTYHAYDLGAVPGIEHAWLAGVVVADGAPDTLLIGADATRASGALYAIGLVRGAGHHIVGFAGSASRVASMPYVDGNVVFVGGTILFPGWPANTVGQLLPGAATPSRSTTLDAIVAGSSGGADTCQGYGSNTTGCPNAAAGINVVPTGIGGAGEIKLVLWPSGAFFQMSAATQADGLLTFSAAQAAAGSTLSGGVTGFAYVPPGSPVFGGPALIASEWNDGNVAVYDVDAQGNPVATTRRPFIQDFKGPEGAFFDPLSGDFIFSTAGDPNDDGKTDVPERVLVVQGFTSPPPPPPPPK